MENKTRILMEDIDLRSIKNVAGICYAGRSGSYLLSNLMDGHSSLLSCPPHSLHNSPFIIREILKHISEKRISNLETILGLVIKNHPFIYNNADHASMLGKPYSKIKVGVDREKFFKNALIILKAHIEKYKNLKTQDLFVLIHFAYHCCKENFKIPKTPSIIWQRHIPLTNEQSSVLNSEFDNFLLFTCIRRLEIALDSHLAHHIYEKPFGTKEEIFLTLLKQFCLSICKNDVPYPQYAVKFEDLHLDTQNTMTKITGLLNISYENILEETTLDGQPFYFYKNGEMITGTNKNLSNELNLRVLNFADVNFIQIYFSKFFRAYSYKIEESNLSAILSSEELGQIFGTILTDSKPLQLL